MTLTYIQLGCICLGCFLLGGVMSIGAFIAILNGAGGPKF